QKSLLRHFHISYLAHTLLTFLLFFQKLTLTADVATIAFGSNIFSHGRNIFSRNNFSTYCCLYCNLKLLPWQQLLQFLAKFAAKFLRPAAVYQCTQRIYFVIIEQYIHFHNITIAVANWMIIK